jgi:TRAP-type C4-dicarboxylate transport system permease large subunit
VACDMGKVKIEALSKECVPFMIALIAVLLLLNFFPVLITAIPVLSGL